MEENSSTLNSQAIELSAQGYFEEAIACLERAISIDSENYLLWYNLGITYRDYGKPKKAKNALLQAYSLNDSDEELLETLALVSFSMDDLDEAEDFCREGLSLNSANYKLWNDLGVFNFKKKMYNAAAEAFEFSVSINPLFYDGLYNLRDTYEELGNTEGVKECQKRMDEIKK